MLTFFGWINAGLFLLILVKFLTKRLHLKRLNTFFMKYIADLPTHSLLLVRYIFYPHSYRFTSSHRS